MMIGTEVEEMEDSKDDINIKDEPIGYILNDVGSAFVTGFTPTLPIEKFIKKEVEEHDEEQEIDIKYEYLDQGLQRSAIENIHERGDKLFECSKCSYKTKYRIILEKHIMAIHEKEKAPRYACKLCSHVTIYKGVLNKHMKYMHEEKKTWFECYNCGYKSKHKSDLKKHIFLVHGRQRAPTYACELCLYETIYKANLNQHIMYMHQRKEKQFECHKCNFKSKYKTALTRHVITIHEDQKKEKQFDCDKCSFKSKYKNALKRHIMTVHEESGYKKRHILLIHEGQKAYTCELCTYETIYKGNLKKHIRKIHEKEKVSRYKCELCSYQTIREENVRRHIERAHIESSFECILCQKSFRNKQDIDAHYVSAHWDQRDLFKHLLTNKINYCSKCPYVTTITRYFKTHLLTHEEDGNRLKQRFKYQCSKCSYAAVNKSHLESHLLTHEEGGNKLMFECHTCGYKCIKKSSLKLHVRLHADQLPYTCTVCNKGFPKKSQLHSHIVSRHNGNQQLMKTVTSKIHQCPNCSYKAVNSGHFKKHLNCCIG